MPQRLEEFPCPRACGNTVELMQVEVMGRWLPERPGPCPACEAGEQEALLASEIQGRSAADHETVESRTRGILTLLERAGVSPWEHGHATLENFDSSDSPEALGAARSFVADVLRADRYDPVPGLYLAGPTGAGKSHLAVGIARALLLSPRVDPAGIVFDPADVLASRIRSLYGGKGDVDALLRKRETARVWILDDLGREPPHPDVIGHLTMLIAQRSLRGIVVTGNLMPNEYEGRHNDLARIGSRLGTAYVRTVRVRGRDRRFDGALPKLLGVGL